MRLRNIFVVMILLASQALWAGDQTANKYAVVWDSISKENLMFKKHIQEQAAVLLSLWNKGVVENIYLNHELDEVKYKRKASIVFFIEAKNEDEANKILKQLPFVKHDVLKYKLYPVGVLWLKEAKDYSALPK